MQARLRLGHFGNTRTNCHVPAPTWDRSTATFRLKERLDARVARWLARRNHCDADHDTIRPLNADPRNSRYARRDESMRIPHRSSTPDARRTARKSQLAHLTNSNL